MKIIFMILVSFAATQAQAKLVGPYPDSTDLPIILQEAFKRLTEMDMGSLKAIPTKCKALSLENKTALADFDVLTGFPYASSINPSFWKWYYECIESYTVNSLAVSESGFKKALGASGAKHFEGKSLKNIKETLWQSTPSVVRIDISRSIINTLIRDDLLLEFGTQPQQIVTEIETVLNHPSRVEFKVDQALIVILQTVFKQKSFILE